MVVVDGVPPPFPDDELTHVLLAPNAETTAEGSAQALVLAVPTTRQLTASPARMDPTSSKRCPDTVARAYSREPVDTATTELAHAPGA